MDAIWLSPIFPSPMADFGYDLSNYTDIDLLGCLQDFDASLVTPHASGLKLLLDLVPNHTSDRHPWFKESRSSGENPKRDWYIWHDPAPDGGPPNNWLSEFAASEMAIMRPLERRAAAKSLGVGALELRPGGASAAVTALVASIWNGDSFPDNVTPTNADALSQPLDRRDGVGAFAGMVAAQQAQDFTNRSASSTSANSEGSCRLGCRLFR